MKKIAVVGCGRWGTTLAWLSAQICPEVLLVGQADHQDYKDLCANRANQYLTLPKEVRLTDYLAEVVKMQPELLIIAINGQNVRSFFRANQGWLVDYSGLVVLAMKSLEKETGCRLSEIYEQEVGRKDNLLVLVGPAHPQTLVKNQPTALVVSGQNQALIQKVVKEFHHPSVRLYWNCDLVGVEIGAALKNTVGIMGGILMGLEWESTLGLILTRGPLEVGRLVEAKGGNRQTVFGLSHLGDYAATVFSPFSYNFQFGKSLARGENWDQSKVVEGTETIKAVKVLSHDFTDVDLPLHQALYEVVVNGVDIKEQISQLFQRTLKEEFWG